MGSHVPVGRRMRQHFSVSIVQWSRGGSWEMGQGDPMARLGKEALWSGTGDLAEQTRGPT